MLYLYRRYGRGNEQKYDPHVELQRKIAYSTRISTFPSKKRGLSNAKDGHQVKSIQERIARAESLQALGEEAQRMYDEGVPPRKSFVISLY